jgi:hypothetical protein
LDCSDLLQYHNVSANLHVFLTSSGCFVGHNYSWGVIQTQLVSDKLSSPATLSFIGAIAIGCISIFALINTLTMRRLGARTTCLIGVGFISFGQMVSSFAYKNVGGLFITAGLITGFGTSLCFMVSGRLYLTDRQAVSTLPAQYFVLKRGIANGIVYAGGGIGGAIFSLSLEKMLSRLGVAWTFRVLSFFTLAVGGPAAALIKERAMRRSLSFVEWLVHAIDQ